MEKSSSIVKSDINCIWDLSSWRVSERPGSYLAGELYTQCNSFISPSRLLVRLHYPSCPPWIAGAHLWEAAAQRSASGGRWLRSESISPPRATPGHLQRSTHSYDVPVLGPSLTGVGSWCELKAAPVCKVGPEHTASNKLSAGLSFTPFPHCCSAHFNSWLLWMSTIATLRTPISYLLPPWYSLQTWKVNLYPTRTMDCIQLENRKNKILSPENQLTYFISVTTSSEHAGGKHSWSKPKPWVM